MLHDASSLFYYEHYTNCHAFFKSKQITYRKLMKWWSEITLAKKYVNLLSCWRTTPQRQRWQRTRQCANNDCNSDLLSIFQNFRIIFPLNAGIRESFRVFLERELTFTFAICYRPSVCRRSVCLLSVTFVRPTQPAESFSNFSTPFGTLAIRWHPRKRKFLTEIVLEESLCRGFKRKKGSQI